MDPRTIPHAPADLLSELMTRERLLHFPEPGVTRADLEAGMIEDYWEVGASGGHFDIDVIWQVVRRRAEQDTVAPWRTEDEECRLVAPDTYLLTYLLDQDGRRTRRSTIWRVQGGTWLAVYHQGTVVTGQW
ncbi:hypothetical protein SAMN05421595_2692 [Austwickia chelonae]|uniref:DUF4440 domain-containing protein n=1 Tax=Austwickia chelonae NBRC 105200 TaxID=1184607 RepID=K6VSV2_9MICO|nr:hypothetical protein [Austwickia chelonae]GAB78425.1 hypothetical protein AUCHE_09_00310 [Austwickia chelonae NBRC 105200]SEW39401.1 hypothetical protein SAMN05421595_2692 [Austwickia chelonae]